MRALLGSAVGMLVNHGGSHSEVGELGDMVEHRWFLLYPPPSHELNMWLSGSNIRFHALLFALLIDAGGDAFRGRVHLSVNRRCGKIKSVKDIINYRCRHTDGKGLLPREPKPFSDNCRPSNHNRRTVNDHRASHQFRLILVFLIIETGQGCSLILGCCWKEHIVVPRALSFLTW